MWNPSPHPSTPLLLGRDENPTKFSKSKISVGFPILEEVTVKEGVTIFGGFQFLHEKLKSEISYDKNKTIIKNIFLCNLNLEFYLRI